METADLSANLISTLEQAGYRGKLLSAQHLCDLKNDIDGHHRQGRFDEEFFTEELSKFDFNCLESLSGAKSLIIAAASQPQVRVTFKMEAKDVPCIIPPTYSYATDRHIEALLRLQLEPAGYRVKKADLPWKLLAVRSGLAQYGRNNITYIAGLGSFYRLVAFVSDFPGAEDSWGEPQILSDCGNCEACTKACPSGAIGTDRFLLHAERCITFHNERQVAFPTWLNSSWHHCLVGCMVCQKVCPVDKSFRKWIVDGPTFSVEETNFLMQNPSQDKLPHETAQKLDQLDMLGYIGVIGRNLQALVSKQGID
jgi:epoxyqueuosine reductase